MAGGGGGGRRGGACYTQSASSVLSHFCPVGGCAGSTFLRHRHAGSEGHLPSSACLGCPGHVGRLNCLTFLSPALFLFNPATLNLCSLISSSSLSLSLPSPLPLSIFPSLPPSLSHSLPPSLTLSLPPSLSHSLSLTPSLHPFLLASLPLSLSHSLSLPPFLSHSLTLSLPPSLSHSLPPSLPPSLTPSLPPRLPPSLPSSISKILELLVQRCLVSASPDYTRPGDVFRRIMECVASGIFLPGEQRSHTSLPPARGAGGRGFRRS